LGARAPRREPSPRRGAPALRRIIHL
jgi:hypothetical protein